MNSGVAQYLSRNRLKQLKRLKSRRARAETGKFLLEGIKAISAAYTCGMVEEVIYSPKLQGVAEGRELLAALERLPLTKTRDNWLAALTDAATHQGAVAVGTIPECVWSPGKYRRILLLDRVQDPGNVGALLRAAVAFAFDTVLALPGTADFFNQKVLRSSAGYGLRLQLGTVTPAQVKELQHAGFPLFWGDVKTGAAAAEFDWPEKMILVAGNESRGAAASWRTAGRGVHVESGDALDSLNVAMATAILMYRVYISSRG